MYTFESAKQQGQKRQILIRFATEKEKKGNPFHLFDTLDECKVGIENILIPKLSECNVYYSHEVVNEMVSKILKR